MQGSLSLHFLLILTTGDLELHTVTDSTPFTQQLPSSLRHSTENKQKLLDFLSIHAACSLAPRVWAAIPV